MIRAHDRLKSEQVGGEDPLARFRDKLKQEDALALLRAAEEAIRANRVVIDLLEGIGAEHNATPAQIALAWLLVQKPWIVPIPGTRKLHRLDENNGAVDIALTADELSEIREAMANITVVGYRY